LAGPIQTRPGGGDEEGGELENRNNPLTALHWQTVGDRNHPRRSPRKKKRGEKAIYFHWRGASSFSGEIDCKCGWTDKNGIGAKF